MNESDFENELRKLRPTTPSNRLEEQIARDLAATTTAPDPHSYPRSGTISRKKESPIMRLLSGLGWACGGAAVAVLVTTTMYSTPPSPQAGTQTERAIEVENVFEPAESSRELLATEDSGVIYTEEEEPTRVVRYNSMERYVWANPTTGARIEVEVPREDVVLLPVSFQ